MEAQLTDLYDRYVDTFRSKTGELKAMMKLKRIHTAFVVRNADLIAAGEGFSPHLTKLARMAALLHDTGRYEQLKIYNTFKDSESVDHAVRSHAIVKNRGWLCGLGLPENEIDWILKAILYHNRRDLPESLTGNALTLAQTVRDADKLDIFRVLEDQISHTDWHKDTRAFWNLSTTARPNPAVIEAIENRKPVDYQNIQSLSDFVLIQVGWIISGLSFATSRHLCHKRNHLEFRRNFLHQLTDDPSINRICALANLT